MYRVSNRERKPMVRLERVKKRKLGRGVRSMYRRLR